MDAYTAVLQLATAADTDHAGQHLDYLADYHPAITRTHSGGRAEPEPNVASRGRTSRRAWVHLMGVVGCSVEG